MASSSINVPSASPVAGSRSFLSKLRDGDEIARLITFLFAATVVLITVGLVVELWIERTRPNGSVVEVRHNPLPEGGLVLIYTDITERKRYEETRVSHLSLG